MAIHDIVATTYYLENYDRSKINLEVISTENLKFKSFIKTHLFMFLGMNWKATRASI